MREKPHPSYVTEYFGSVTGISEETINTDDFAGAKSVTQQAVYLQGKCTLLHLCYVTSHVVLFGS